MSTEKAMREKSSKKRRQIRSRFHNIRIIEFPDGTYDLGFVHTLRENTGTELVGGRKVRVDTWATGNKRNMKRLLKRDGAQR